MLEVQDADTVSYRHQRSSTWRAPSVLTGLAWLLMPVHTSSTPCLMSSGGTTPSLVSMKLDPLLASCCFCALCNLTKRGAIGQRSATERDTKNTKVAPRLKRKKRESHVFEINCGLRELHDLLAPAERALARHLCAPCEVVASEVSEV